MEWCFYQWVVSFSLISAGNWATSDLEIDRSVSAPGPEPVSQCESVSDFRKWYDGTVRSNHWKLGIKFLNHRWIIILSICTTNPRLNERYTTTVPVRQKTNHSLHSPKEIGAIQYTENQFSKINYLNFKLHAFEKCHQWIPISKSFVSSIVAIVFFLTLFNC